MKKDSPKKTRSSKPPAASKRKKRPLRAIKKIVKRLLKSKPQASGRLLVKKLGGRMRKAAPKPVYLSPRDTRVTHSAKPSENIPDNRIPDFYGEDKIVLLVRDPWWIYAYWEVTPSREKQVLWKMSGGEAQNARKVMRVYDVMGTSIETCHSFFDIEINEYSSSWYVDTGAPDREWMAEIGFRTASGKFFPIIRSNRVKTPSFGLSDIFDEEWMMPEGLHEKILGLSGGLGTQGGSLEVRRLLEKSLRSATSSPSPRVKSVLPNA